MITNQLAFEQGRLDQALKELFDAIPKAKRPRLFAATSLVECRAKQSLTAFMLLDQHCDHLTDSGELDEEDVQPILDLLKAAGWKRGG